MDSCPSDEADGTQEVCDELPEEASPGDEEPREGGTSSHHLADSNERRRFTSAQKVLLEHVFRETPLPPKTVILQLAERMWVNARNIRIWFQNRRQRFRTLHAAAGNAPPELVNGPTRLTSLEKLIPDLEPPEPELPPTMPEHHHNMVPPGYPWHGHPGAPLSHTFPPGYPPHQGQPAYGYGHSAYGYGPSAYGATGTPMPVPFPSSYPPPPIPHAHGMPSVHAAPSVKKKPFVPYSALPPTCREILTSGRSSYPSKPPASAAEGTSTAQRKQPMAADDGHRKRPRQQQLAEGDSDNELLSPPPAPPQPPSWQLQLAHLNEAESLPPRMGQSTPSTRPPEAHAPGAPAPAHLTSSQTVAQEGPSLPNAHVHTHVQSADTTERSSVPEPVGLVRACQFLGMQGGRPVFRVDDEPMPFGRSGEHHASTGLLWNEGDGTIGLKVGDGSPEAQYVLTPIAAIGSMPVEPESPAPRRPSPEVGSSRVSAV